MLLHFLAEVKQNKFHKQMKIKSRKQHFRLTRSKDLIASSIVHFQILILHNRLTE